VKNETKNESPIETTPIRLSVEETRWIIRLTVAGKPMPGDYHCNALAELGILRRTELSEEKDTALKISECWKRAKAGFILKDEVKVHQAMHDLERLTTDRDRHDTKYLFSLTDLGKQIARGINVRLNGGPKTERMMARSSGRP